jgi:hypothetical protein
MVTKADTRAIETQEQVEVRIPTLEEVGEQIGIPIVIHPWWGSRRQLFVWVHRKCGHIVSFQDYARRWWCFQCECRIPAGEVDIRRLKRGRWLCPAQYANRLKWPMVDGDKVVMWQGRCGARYSPGPAKRFGSPIHRHRQELELIDYSGEAMLVRVSVGNRRLTFLIGRDDGHPFVHVVTKNQVTVAQAYDFMVPKSVWEAQMHGFDVKRQGDWFFVPREFFRELPINEEYKRVMPWPGRLNAGSYYYDGDVIFTNASIEQSRHVAGELIWSWPYRLVRGVVTAPDHPPVQLETWHCAVRNIRTAAVNPDNRSDND